MSSKWSGGRGGRALQSILVYPGDIGLQLLCKAIMLHCSAPQGDYTSRLPTYCPPGVEGEGHSDDRFSPNWKYYYKMTDFSLMMSALLALVVVVAPEMANESDIGDYRRSSV